MEASVSSRAAGYVIVDVQTGRPYIPRIWPSERLAAAELGSLLRGYPPEHEWHRRLAVRVAKESHLLEAASEASPASEAPPESESTEVDASHDSAAAA